MKTKLHKFISRLKRIGLLTFKRAMDPYFTGNSAEVAFFLLMSIVPSIMILAQLLNLFDISMDIIKTLVEEYANKDLALIIKPLLIHSASGALSVFLVVLALWAGSKAIFTLMRITNYAYLGGNPWKNPFTGYIKERVRAVITVFILIFTLVFAISILLFGRQIVEAVSAYLNNYMGRNIDVDEIWLNVRWILGFIMYFFMVTSIYYLLPSSKYSYTHLIVKGNLRRSVLHVVVAWLQKAKNTLISIFPGSIFASIGMMVATWLYTVYLSKISTDNFNILYGTLGAAVLLLLWFYVLAYVLVLGIQINSIWEDSKSPENPPSKYMGNNDKSED